MNKGFNRDQLHQDAKDFVVFSKGFSKSFGSTPKKIQGEKIGFFEEVYVRFRLSLVEMGISKVIRLVIAIAVAVLLYFILFRNSDTSMRWIVALGFIVFYAWLMMDHLVVDGKPVDMVAKGIVGVHGFWNGVLSEIQAVVIDIFGSLNPFAKK